MESSTTYGSLPRFAEIGGRHARPAAAPTGRTAAQRGAASLRSRAGQWRRSLSAALVLLAAAWGWSPPAAVGAAALEAIDRRVLILYDSATGQSAHENLGYDICQVVLNHQGLLTDYQDVADPAALPPDAAMGGVRGVITVFRGDLGPKADRVLGWIERQAEAGRRVVVLGALGVTVQPNTPAALRERVERIFRHIGLDFHGRHLRRQTVVRYAYQDPQAFGFERPLPALPGVYTQFTPADPAVRVYLSLRRTDEPDSLSAVVATGPGGGLALNDYFHWQDPLTYRKQWYLDPFLFFREALGLEGIPAPDPTTSNGLRVGFSHIDADGFPGPSRIDGRRCAEVVRDEVLRRYDYPVSVSVITGEIDPGALGSREMVALARAIFALPNVEPASHSYSHPFYWDPGDPDEAARYPHQYGIPIPGYRHDREAEIDGSLAYVTRHLAPPEKPCRLFFWTGNCLPTEADLARIAAGGFLNINGGDTLMDAVNDSYTSVAPYYRKVGPFHQFHTGQANENLLTNLWTGPFHGYREIITTMERTGAPRRVAPVDIYYHFYSGEYPQSLRALQTVYEWALRQDLALMFTSRYLEMVRDYLRVALWRGGDGETVVRDYGACRTLRFDAGAPAPDLSRCENVVGFVRDPQGLYVSLGPGDAARVVLGAGGPAVAGPYIRRAAGRIEGLAGAPGRLRFRHDGFGRQPLELGGLAALEVAVVRGTAVEGAPLRRRADENGILRVPAVGTGTVEVSW